MRPPPSRSAETSALEPSGCTGSPVDTSADLICSTVQVGCRSLSTAAPPATCGLAILVPLSSVHWSFGKDESTSTPGAVTSGFNWSERGVGPVDENGAIASAGPSVPMVDAATAIACGAVAGELTPPMPASMSPPSIPRFPLRPRDHAGTGCVVEGLDDDVARQRDLRLTERQVDHVHAVTYGRFDPGCDLRRVAVETEPRRRDGQHFVVPEVRRRRNAGDAGLAACRRGECVVVAGGDACDVRRVVGKGRIERGVRVAPMIRRRGKRPRHYHLWRRVGAVAFREAGRIAESRRIEIHVALIESVVDDRNLHALPRRGERRPPNGRRPDQL